MSKHPLQVALEEISQDIGGFQVCAYRDNLAISGANLQSVSIGYAICNHGTDVDISELDTAEGKQTVDGHDILYFPNVPHVDSDDDNDDEEEDNENYEEGDDG